MEYRRPRADVVFKWKSTKATGYQTHLYSLPGETDARSREQVELRIMSGIDDDAAPVFRRLLAEGSNALSASERSAWTTFLMSLIFRTPTRLAWFDSQIRGADYAFDDEDRRTYQALRSPHHPTDPTAFFETADADDLSVARISLMLKLIGSKQIGTGVFEMHWHVHDLEGIQNGLLTCDEPIVMSNGLNLQSSFLLLPLGPRKLFIAGSTARAVWSFSSQKPRDLERAINDSVITQAEELVVGHHTGHRSFIERRLGRKPLSDDGVLGRHSWKIP